MYIEIHGVEFVNKGAELMLHAVLQQVGRRIPAAELVLSPGKIRPYKDRAKLGAYQKIWFTKNGVPWGMYLGRLVNRRLRQRFGLVTHDEIGIVFDASGFAYGDEWGAENAVIMAKAFRRWKKIGTRIILLPQAMGPFGSGDIRQAVSSMIRDADLVFPRDDVSFKHVTDLVGRLDHVVQAPDFTNMVEGVAPEWLVDGERSFCIIPNCRMMDKTSADKSRAYVPFLAHCIQYLAARGLKVFMLLHAGDDDLRVCNEVNKACGHELPVIREPDPLKVKGIIGRCRGIVASRYHALVSALSQGVPVLATGWSHKYETLLTEYDFLDGFVSPDAAQAEIEAKLNRVMDGDGAARRKLLERAKLQKARTEEMWRRVFECLRV